MHVKILKIHGWIWPAKQSDLWRSKCWERLTQRQIKDRPAYGRGIMQARSQIYGRIKLAKEITFIDESYLENIKNGRGVEHEKFILTWTM